MQNVDLPLATKLLIGGAVAWELSIILLLAIKSMRRPPLLAYEPRRPVPWVASDIALIFIAFVLVSVAIAILPAMLRPGAAHAGKGDATTSPIYFVIFSLQELAVFGIAVFILRNMAGATVADIGVGTKRLAKDLTVGAISFLACAVPVYGSNVLLERWSDTRYEHLIIRSVEARPTALMLIATAVSAVLVAPLFEEFVFRVLLQGWFEAIEARRQVARGRPADDRGAWWPIVLSAELFAVMHMENGLAVYPLMLFGLVLGYLYQRTHRIWPSFTAHFLLNAVSMGFLWWQIRHPGA